MVSLTKKQELKAYLNKAKPLQGWYDLETLFNNDLITKIETTATTIKANCEVFLVIGIGGSYLGALSVIEALNPYFYNQSKQPEIYFLGNNLSSDYYVDLINVIKDKEIIVNVISKSGSTLEVIKAYEIILKLMQTKYTATALKKRIIITTGTHQGQLRKEVEKEGYQSFVIPEQVGGRYSVFTPAGLLPIAVAGFNIRELGVGAKQANLNIELPIRYAVNRDLMFKRGKLVEAYTVYEPKLKALTEWLKQLYGESLGKGGTGILPISLINTRDLHSFEQYMQQGNKILFETIIRIKEPKQEMLIPEQDITLNYLNQVALTATLKGHQQQLIPQHVFTLTTLTERNLGYLLQFFMISCALSGCLRGINPFDQPGVEVYKAIMRETLNK